MTIGDDLAGEMLAAPQSDDGANWGSVRLLDYALAQTAHALTQSQLWLPGQPTPLDLPIADLDSIGKMGLVHRDITGPAHAARSTKLPPARRQLIPPCGTTTPSKKPASFANPIRSCRFGRAWRARQQKCGQLPAAPI